MRAFTFEVMSESLPREAIDEAPATCSSLVTSFTFSIARTVSSICCFASSLGASPVSSTRRLKLVAFACAVGNFSRMRPKTFHSMVSSSR